MGAYYGNKGASRLDGIDDVGSVKKKSNSESTGGATQKVISEFKSPVLDGKRVGGEQQLMIYNQFGEKIL
ncbi:hypothetical protein [Enterococcus sp. DIV2163]|uniref:hypothetical protein n=1 Tax=Enterococcus sp. DIV2163 TaxID=2774834 RepID=UPI003D2FAF9C